MNLKKTLLGTATMLVVLGMLPGAAASVATDDAVTRSFSIRVIGQIDLKEGGTGIYGSGPCPLVVFGVRPNIPSVVYYQDDRETTNLKTGEMDLFGGSELLPIVFEGTPCPIPGSGPGDLTVAVAPMNFFGPYDGIVIDQLLCLQGNQANNNLDVDCLPLADNSRATVTFCNKDDAGFIFSNGNDKWVTKSAIPGLGSHAITCLDEFGASAYKPGIKYYHNGPTAPGGSYCQDWFFGIGGWGTDFCVIQVADNVHLNDDTNDTGYLVTCMETTAIVVDTSKTPPVVLQTFRSHDYILVLDLDGTADNWAAAKDIHHNPDALEGFLQNGDPGFLQGWHDLSGKNGYPCPDGEYPEDKKAKTNDFGENVPTRCPDPLPLGCPKKDE